MIASTPPTPYYAVIFTSIASNDREGYDEMSDYMFQQVSQQLGFLGFESASGKLGITVSYWKDLKSIQSWKQNTEHQKAQSKGISIWYDNYKIRICKVERDYGMDESH